MCVYMRVCVCTYYIYVYIFLCVYIYKYIHIYSFFTCSSNTRFRHFPNQPFTNGKHAVMYKSEETSETETVRQSLAVVLTTQSESRLFEHISRRLFFFLKLPVIRLQNPSVAGKNNREASGIINNDFFSSPTPLAFFFSHWSDAQSEAIYRHLLSGKIISPKIYSFSEMHLTEVTTVH